MSAPLCRHGIAADRAPGPMCDQYCHGTPGAALNVRHAPTVAREIAAYEADVYKAGRDARVGRKMARRARGAS